MECKATGDSVLICENVMEGSFEQPVDAEFTLPDYCPDIGKILKCRAVPVIAARDVKPDGVKAEGTTRLEVIYVDGRDKNVRCCTHDVPFSLNIPANNCPEGAKAAIAVHVDYMNCRATSQRRVDIHGAFTISVKVTAPRRQELLTGAEGAGVRTRVTGKQISVPVSRTQTAFSISEALELSEGKPPAAAVVRTGAVLTVLDCKPIANKLIVKGEARLKVVYCPDGAQELESMEYVIPFNQFLDVPGLDDTCSADAHLEVSSVDIALRTDNDGEYRRMNVELRAFADVRAYRAAEITAVTDAYSVECELNMERRYIRPERFCPSSAGRTACAARMESDGEIVRLLDAWCEPGALTADYRDGKAVVSGKAAMCAIVRLDSGDCAYIEKTGDFECLLQSDCGDGSIRVEPRAAVNSCGCTIAGANRLDIRAEIDVAAAVFEELPMQCVCSITPDETRMKNPASRPAVVMYFADSGEELWSIAREHNASVDDIISDNGLNSERLAEDTLLLIAVR